MKKYYYIYKIINLINQKYYIGQHATNDLDDGYLGSGLKIKRSINKYGKENFKKIILEYATNYKELDILEEKYVTIDVLRDPLCMNLKTGGGNLNTRLSEESRKKISNSNKGRITSKETKQKISNAWHSKPIEEKQKISIKISKKLKGMFKDEKNPMFGKHWSPEERKQKSNSMKGKNKGMNNGMYGKKWSNEHIEMHSNIIKEWHKNNPHPMLGHKHSKESIQKISNASKGKNNGKFRKKFNMLKTTYPNLNFEFMLSDEFWLLDTNKRKKKIDSYIKENT